MTNKELGRWLLVALAIVGLAFAAPVVSAHGEETAQEDKPAADGTAAGEGATSWAVWMDGHTTDHAGPHTAEEMESHTGVTVDEMAGDMADGNHRVGGTNGQRHGC